MHCSQLLVLLVHTRATDDAMVGGLLLLLLMLVVVVLLSLLLLLLLLLLLQATPGGVYTRKDVTWEVFSHEPEVVPGPNGEYIMYFTADLRSQVFP